MGPNPCRKARIVARISGRATKEAESFDGASISKQPWISVQRPDEKSNSSLMGRVKISLGSEKTMSKQTYDVDECYEQDVSTEEIFSREVKPLIPGLFSGHNITVFAYGPQKSGKTYTIQGTEEELGLVMLTIDSIQPQAEEEGKIITVSVFEVHQDRVIDLLDSKRPEVSVFDDGHGKIRLKGLSKVKVNSSCEFQKIYSPAANAHKPLQKTIFDPPHRSHVGCIVHVVSPKTESSNAQLLGKINFIDLASYEDSRRKSSDGSSLSETTRINKSLFAVHNVLYALNANETCVPYRESKLTRMLQDSLGGMNRAIMITCMNPSFCSETVQTISIASRSCQAGFLACLDKGKSRSASKTTAMASPQVLKSASKFGTRTSLFSPKNMKPMSASASAKKQSGVSQLQMTVKRPSGIGSQVKGRKLFVEANQSKNAEQANQGNTRFECASAVEFSIQTEVNKCPENAAIESSTQKELMLSQDKEPTCESSSLKEEQIASKPASNAASDVDSSQLLLLPQDVKVENNDVTATPSTCHTPNTGNFLLEDKENLSFTIAASPPLSARIRELSNNLKSLCVSTESSLKIAQDSSIRNQVINESFEPKTPVFLQWVRVDDDQHEIATFASPWKSFQMRGSGMKDSLVQEYLKFLNSASKEELKGLKGIGEKRATYILEKREESPEAFKNLDDLKDIGLSEKQINGMLKKVAGDLFV